MDNSTVETVDFTSMDEASSSSSLDDNFVLNGPTNALIAFGSLVLLAIVATIICQCNEKRQVAADLTKQQETKETKTSTPEMDAKIDMDARKRMSVGLPRCVECPDEEQAISKMSFKLDPCDKQSPDHDKPKRSGKKSRQSAKTPLAQS
ncbi:expressed unknown protein [Seminavis robusta]|uniref:Uncharacterized protein n=1 Tax=Seminavis robusta TaxID=568900 RepID=A0A9N8HL92_9STRA|nr:expressed unknown protein [Seminavis robusta]|eukprot:Sro898_g217560.1 n/a (149) ;mRNA; r:9654-10192